MTLLSNDGDGFDSLAQAIVDTVREPFLILDADLRVVIASRSFYKKFKAVRQNVERLGFFDLVSGRFDIAELRELLANVQPEHDVVRSVELDRDFPGVGRRILLLSARAVRDESIGRPLLLVGFEDVTVSRGVEELLRQKNVLLDEMRHRIANSLQIIASIIMLKARNVSSEETRLHLHDAHRRVLSVAAVQEHLHSTGRDELISVESYLTKLCASLTDSVVGESQPVSLACRASGEVTAAQAVSLGLLVTELVFNALKHAFPGHRADAEVVVRYEVNGTDWKLTVSDNGAGAPEGKAAPAKGGLGTSLVRALAAQLDAKFEVASGPDGLTATVTHATFTPAVRVA